MSVQQMALVWGLQLPHNQAWVLMALADHADHEGGSVHPSIEMIAWKTGYSERQVHRIVASLINKGLMMPIRNRKGGRGKAVLYRLTLEKGVKKTPFINPDNMSPIEEERVPSVSKKGAIAMSIKGAIAMAPQPSLTIKEPSVNTCAPDDTHAPDEKAAQPTATVLPLPLALAGQLEPEAEPLQTTAETTDQSPADPDHQRSWQAILSPPSQDTPPTPEQQDEALLYVKPQIDALLGRIAGKTMPDATDDREEMARRAADQIKRAKAGGLL